MTGHSCLMLVHQFLVPSKITIKSHNFLLDPSVSHLEQGHCLTHDIETSSVSEEFKDMYGVSSIHWWIHLNTHRISMDICIFILFDPQDDMGHHIQSSSNTVFCTELNQYPFISGSHFLSMFIYQLNMHACMCTVLHFHQQQCCCQCQNTGSWEAPLDCWIIWPLQYAKKAQGLVVNGWPICKHYNTIRVSSQNCIHIISVQFSQSCSLYFFSIFTSLLLFLQLFLVQ